MASTILSLPAYPAANEQAFVPLPQDSVIVCKQDLGGDGIG